MYARKRDGGAFVRLKMNKIFEITRLSSLQYALTWVARPERDKVNNFTILPAASPPPIVKPGTITKNKLDEFINDSRKLFQENNSPTVEEFIIRQKVSTTDKKDK